MDRTPYLLPFNVDSVPEWICAKCRKGFLTIDKKSMVSVETPESIRNKQHEEWEPDWIRSIFSCVFQCNNPMCRQPVSCCGSGRVNQYEYEDEDNGWVQETEDVFTPQYFHPPLILMDIPSKCPKEVSQHLYESFALYYADPAASLNCMRSAIEALLTDLGIKRFVIVKKKRKSISLHQRIQLLPPKYQAHANMLMAVKWLGNAGSHDTGVIPDDADVRMTYDLLEHILSEIYVGREKILMQAAKKVNKRKGPLK
jgi:hypothetical protein